MGNVDFLAGDPTPPAGAFEPIPEGEYVLILTESEVKATRDGVGKRLAITMEIADGPFKGRKVWDGLNIVNANATAQNIGRGQFKALKLAVGRENAVDSSELHGRPFRALVKIEKQDGREPQNRIKAFLWKEKETAAASVPSESKVSLRDDQIPF